MKKQPLILLIGLCLCAVCGLFPPRYLPNDHPDLKQSDVTRAFLFSSHFYSAKGYVVLFDEARFFGEITLILSLTGIVALIPSLRGRT
jgi:hypothetical protein